LSSSKETIFRRR